MSTPSSQQSYLLSWFMLHALVSFLCHTDLYRVIILFLSNVVTSIVWDICCVLQGWYPVWWFHNGGLFRPHERWLDNEDTDHERKNNGLLLQGIPTLAGYHKSSMCYEQMWHLSSPAWQKPTSSSFLSHYEVDRHQHHAVYLDITATRIVSQTNLSLLDKIFSLRFFFITVQNRLRQ